jgi:hypothetical protein
MSPLRNTVRVAACRPKAIQSNPLSMSLRYAKTET